MSSNVDYVTALPRDQQERKGKIRMFSGIYVNPLDLRPEDICIEDIAHHLSLICRYTGACPFHFSVAQHSLMVSALMGAHGLFNREAGLAGLLHDASEAYLNDIASPVKHDPRMAFYREAEDRAERIIFAKFGLDHRWLALTKVEDDKAFFAEVNSWWGDNVGSIPERSPRYVERKFLATYRELTA